MEDTIVKARFKRVITRFNDDVLGLRLPHDYVRQAFLKIASEIERSKTLVIGSNLPPLRSATSDSVNKENLSDFFASAFPNDTKLAETIFPEAVDQPLIVMFHRDIWVLRIVDGSLFAFYYTVFTNERVVPNSAFILSDYGMEPLYKRGFRFEDKDFTYIHNPLKIAHVYDASAALFFAYAYKTLLANKKVVFHLGTISHDGFVQSARKKRHKEEFVDINTIVVNDDFAKVAFKYIASSVYNDVSTGTPHHRRGYLVVDKTEQPAEVPAE